MTADAFTGILRASGYTILNSALVQQQAERLARTPDTGASAELAKLVAVIDEYERWARQATA